MRHLFSGRARDTYGKIQAGIPVTIYFANTVSAAPVYTTYSAVTASTVAPQVSADAAGYFEFYVDDTEIIPTNIFDIVCQSVTYENIDIFKGAWFNPRKYFVL